MKANTNSAGIVAMLITALLCLHGASLWASSGQAVPDVRIVIDISGSMKDNDPNNLRGPALELLVQQLPDGAKAGVWTFGQWVNMLVKHRQVDDQWREQAIAAIDQISTHGLYTNIPQALETASYDIDHIKPQYQTSLIVLTDGRVELSDSADENRQARTRVLDDLLPKIAKAGIAVHTVALSAQADNSLLQALARETNGLFARADSAQQLHGIFLKALDAAAPSAQVPLSGNLFLIDDSVDEFTLLVFKTESAPQTSLVSPAGVSYDVFSESDRVRWYSSDSYDLITVVSPAAGDWSLFADEHADNRVTIVSNLEVEVDRIDKNVELGKSVQLRLRLLDSGAVIDDRALLGLIDVNTTLFSSYDRQWDISVEPANIDGEFSLTLPELNLAGDYELVISVDGKTFRRVDTQIFTAVESMAPGVDEKPLLKTQEDAWPVWMWAVVAGVLLLIGCIGLYFLGYFRSEEDYEDDYEYEDGDEYEEEYEGEFVDDVERFSVDDQQNTTEDWDDIPVLTEPATEFIPTDEDRCSLAGESDDTGVMADSSGGEEADRDQSQIDEDGQDSEGKDRK